MILSGGRQDLPAICVAMHMRKSFGEPFLSRRAYETAFRLGGYI